MRLLDTTTKKLRTFNDEATIGEPYAILSHRWSTDEVTLQELERLQQSGNFTAANFGKIQGYCDRALQDGFKLAWVDSCCIDKTDNTELAEAINSMFRWYHKSARCYVYLADVEAHDEDLTVPNSAFRGSDWFTRGWTLQEMLAPRHVFFYSKSWQLIGLLGRSSPLTTVASEITGIPLTFLVGSDRADLRIASIAQRMSWAANRQTKRGEDVAYSLLGLFGVNMPLLYGEGADRAFKRLQEEIIRRTSDDSILAWGFGVDSDRFSGSSNGSPLARSPADFEGCGNLINHFPDSAEPHFSLASSGLRIQLHLVPQPGRAKVAGLLRTSDYSNETHDHRSTRVAIPLEVILNPGYKSEFGLLTGRLAPFNVDYPAMLLARKHKPAFILSNKSRRFKFLTFTRLHNVYIRDEQINRPDFSIDPLLGYVRVVTSQAFDFRILHANVVEHPFLNNSKHQFINTRPDLQMPYNWGRIYLHITERRSTFQPNALSSSREFVAMFEYKHSETRAFAKT